MPMLPVHGVRCPRSGVAVHDWSPGRLLPAEWQQSERGPLGVDALAVVVLVLLGHRGGASAFAFGGEIQVAAGAAVSVGPATVMVREATEGGTMNLRCDVDPAADVAELTPEEQHDLLDREARKILGIGADEFAKKWHAGEFSENDDPRVTQVAMLLPDAWP